MSTFGHQFQLIFEYLPQGILILNTSAQVVYCNRSALAMLFSTQEEALQSDFTAILSSATRTDFNQRFTQILSGTDDSHFQIEGEFCINDITGWWQIDVSYISSPEHSPFVFAVIDDITNKRHGEQRLIREREDALKATKTKSAFLANVSHEIRTPIHTITGMSELLLDTKLDVEQREYAGQILFSTEILLSLVNDVLDLSKIEAGKLSLEIIEFDLYKTVEDAADMISLNAHKKGIELIIDIDQRVPILVKGDPLRLRQILVNFLSNALKFTRDGNIMVRVTPGKDESRPGAVRIEVEDSGIGIPKDQLPNLFQAFRQIDDSTTRNYGGTGLGLSISKSLVRMMQGKIGVRSRLGQGSVFWVEIPFTEIRQKNDFSQASLGELQGKRALIIDDNPKAGRVVGRYLESWGLSSQLVHDGRTAIDLLRSAVVSGNPYDIVLIDLLLSGMDGWQVAGDINADTRINSTRLILMVPNGQLGADAKMKRLGWFDDYVTKPVHIRGLYSKLQGVLLEDLDLPSLESLDDGLDEIPENPIVPPHIHGTALLAEDHEVNQKLFQTILEHCGMHVLTANNGREAIDIFARQRIDIVFMDVQMPVMNGYTAASHIRAADSAVPIIGVTANALQDEREKCLQAGMNDYLPKPFKAHDIYPLLRRYISAKLDPDLSGTGSEETFTDSGFDFSSALETFLGKKEVLVRVIKAFRERGAQQILDIEHSIHADDFDNARILSHGIKGGAGHLEAHGLARTAGNVEDACVENQKHAALKHLKQLQLEFSRFTADADRVLNDETKERSQ